MLVKCLKVHGKLLDRGKGPMQAWHVRLNAEYDAD